MFDFILGKAADAAGGLLTQHPDAVCTLLRPTVNGAIDRYGHVTEMRIRDGHILLEIRLHGITENMDADLSDITVSNDGLERMTIGSATSRVEFLNNILQDFIVGRTFDLPIGDGSVRRLVINALRSLSR